MRDSFVFYRSFLEAVQYLPTEIKAQVLTAIIEYGLNGTENDNADPIVKGFLVMAKPQINKNNIRYENGKKGGRPRNSDNQIETEQEPKDNQIETEQEPNVNDNVNDNVNNITSLDREVCKNSEDFLPETVQTPKVDCEKIVNLYHSICTDYPRIVKLSDARRRKMRIRFIDEMKSDYSILRKVFEKMQESKFLRGDNRQGWKATFDWLFENGKNWVKVLEGNYDNKIIKTENQKTYVSW